MDQPLRGPHRWAPGFFTGFAKYGIVTFVVLLFATYIHGRHHDDVLAVAASVWAAGAALAALGIGQIIGAAVDRARPYETMAGVHVLVDKTSDFSCPSDHATAVGAVAPACSSPGADGGARSR